MAHTAGVLRWMDTSSFGQMKMRRGGCLLYEGAPQIYGTTNSLGETVWVRSRGFACNVLGHKQLKRFLEGIRETFFLQALEGATTVLHG